MAAGLGEIDRAGAAKGRSRRLGGAGGDRLECRLAHEAGDGAAQAHDLGLLAGGGIAVARLVHGIEALLDAVAILGREQLDRKLDRDGVLLPDIAHVGRALHGDAGNGDPAAAHGLASAPLHLGVDGLHGRERCLGERREPGIDEIAPQVRDQHAIGGEMAGRTRDDDLGDAQFARDHGRVQGPGAAIGDEREIGGIEAALGGDPAHHVGHLGGGDAQDAVGGLREIEAERRGDTRFERALCALEVEPHLAAEKPVGAEPPENEIGVGDGRLRAAEPVAYRAGLRARAFRPDMQRAHLDARDRAAAGADLLDVDHRNLHRQPGGVAADERAAGHQHLAAMDDAGLGGGAAHVEGDGVL